MIDTSDIRFLSFDCYGTLIDWEQGILTALSEVFENYRNHSREQVLESFARWESRIEAGPFQRYAQVLVDVLQGMSTEFSVNVDQERLLAESVGQWEPFSDTLSALRRLEQRFHLVVLSNVDRDMFLQTERKLQIKFHQVLTSEQIGSYKPARRNFEYLLQRLETTPDAVLHVAQSLYHDHVPARELGIRSVWVDRPSIVPGQGATPAANAEPELHVRSLAELAAALVPAER